MSVALWTVLGALGALLAAFGVRSALNRLHVRQERAVVRRMMGEPQEEQSRLRALELAVSDIAGELTRRLTTQDAQIQAMQSAVDSQYKKMRAVEARIDRKRQLLAEAQGDDEEPDDEPAAPWEENGAPAGPQPRPMTLEQRVWSLRHGGGRA